MSKSTTIRIMIVQARRNFSVTVIVRWPPVTLADFDLAIEVDPNLKGAYIDQSIAWYRMGNLHRAFGVIAQAVHIESSHRVCDFTAPKGVALSNKN